MSTWTQEVALNAGDVNPMTDAGTDIGVARGRATATATILTDRPDISQFEADWERLFVAPGNEPSTSFEWTQALLQNRLLSDDRFFLIGVSRGAEMLALLPLVIRSTRLFGGRLRVLCPVSDLRNTHSDVLASSLDQSVVSALMTAFYELPARWDVFRLWNVLEGDSLVDRFAGAVHDRPLASLVRDAHASYFLELPDSYDRYLEARSAKFRNYLRRTERKVAAESDVRILEMTTVDEVGSGYEMLLEIERASWKHQHGTAISSAPQATGFFRDLCFGAAARGRLQLQVLSIRGRPVAYNLGYVHDSTYYYLKTSFAEDLKPLGVATFLRARLVRSLIERGLRVMDFPAQPHEWERQWTETVRWHKRLTLFRGTAPGFALALAQHLRHRKPRPRAVRHLDTRTRGPR
jgi:CelD/BcsL family acetyltransferase involved in cellulose biosynthesis